MEVVLSPVSNNMIDFLWHSHKKPWTCDCGNIVECGMSGNEIFAIVNTDEESIKKSENLIKDGVLVSIYDSDGSLFIQQYIPSERFGQKIRIGIRCNR